jgi:voltage-gated potassium channel
VDERARRLERIFEVPMIVAALLTIPVLVVQQSSLGGDWKHAATILNWVVWAAFAVETVVMLAVVPERRQWLRRHPVEVAVVLLTLPFLPSSLHATRLLRAFRVLRLFPLLRFGRRVFSLEGLRFAGLLALLTALGGGAAFSAVEKHQDMWDGVWWAAETMTTVGYGDVYPKTTGGRMIAIVLLVVGVSFVALLTGALAQRFLRADVEEIEKAEVELAVTEADVADELREVLERLHRLERTVAANTTRGR